MRSPFRPRSRDSGQVRTRTREFGERRTLIGFLPEATQLRGPTRHFRLLSMGAQGPENLSGLADLAGTAAPAAPNSGLRKIIDEDRTFVPEQQVWAALSSVT